MTDDLFDFLVALIYDGEDAVIRRMNALRAEGLGFIGLRLR